MRELFEHNRPLAGHPIALLSDPQIKELGIVSHIYRPSNIIYHTLYIIRDCEKNVKQKIMKIISFTKKM
jgi:hypothetical protein